MPEAVHVKFDGCTVDEGLGEGVVRMVPTNADWKFKTHDMIGKNKVPKGCGHCPNTVWSFSGTGTHCADGARHEHGSFNCNVS